MKLEDLATQELKILEKVYAIQGYIEEKSERIIKLKIDEEYRVIHSKYAVDNSLEALKRSLFLIWYSVAEPIFQSGIGDLSIESTELTINKIEKTLLNNESDNELEWMLSYYSNWKYVFERFDNCPELQKRLNGNIKTTLPEWINRDDMNNRGQMGHYWNSLNLFQNKKNQE